MSLRAAKGKVIIKEKSYESESVIHLLHDPNPLRDVSEGVVVSKGSDYLKEDKVAVRSIPEVSEGVNVVYTSLTILKNEKRYNPNEIEHEGERYIVADFGDILGIYE